MRPPRQQCRDCIQFHRRQGADPACEDLLLVFNPARPMLDSMDQLPWYRRLLARAAQSDRKTTLAKAGQGGAEAQFGLGLKVPDGNERTSAFEILQPATPRANSSRATTE